MALVEMKCPNCGANIVGDNKKKVNCIYCHTEFTVTNDSKGAGSAGGFEADENEKKLKNAETFLTVLNKKDKAFAIYDEFSMLNPDDYRGWWGKAKIYTDDFKNINCTDVEYKLTQENVNLALKVAEGEELEEIEKIWQDFKEAHERATGCVTPAKGASDSYANFVQSRLDELRMQLAEKEGDTRNMSAGVKLLSWSRMPEIKNIKDEIQRLEGELERLRRTGYLNSNPSSSDREVAKFNSYDKRPDKKFDSGDSSRPFFKSASFGEDE